MMNKLHVPRHLKEFIKDSDVYFIGREFASKINVDKKYVDMGVNAIIDEALKQTFEYNWQRLKPHLQTGDYIKYVKLLSEGRFRNDPRVINHTYKGFTHLGKNISKFSTNFHNSGGITIGTAGFRPFDIQNFTLENMDLFFAVKHNGQWKGIRLKRTK